MLQELDEELYGGDSRAFVLKYGLYSERYRTLAFETIDTIVTDAIGAEDRARLEESGIDVLVAG